MIKTSKLHEILASNTHLIISFLGYPRHNSAGVPAPIFTYHGHFELKKGRLKSDLMDYSRSITKICCIRTSRDKGSKLLWGKLCKSCNTPVPKVWRNCPRCGSYGIESRY